MNSRERKSPCLGLNSSRYFRAASKLVLIPGTEQSLTDLVHAYWKIFVRCRRTCNQSSYFFFVCWREEIAGVFPVSEPEELDG